MLVSSEKKLYLFLSKNKISQQKKMLVKKQLLRKKTWPKKENNYSNDISSKYTGKFIGQGKKTLCAFYREIKSESTNKKNEAKKKVDQKKNN